ncbi:MAG: cysteine desulfurase family protein [Marmoricola sp.]
MTHYLDHAATTPMLPSVVDAVADAMRRTGNASSLHASGRAARRAVEESRERIAGALSCRPGEVIFTSGGTEADNLAVKGGWWARREADPGRRAILVSAVEHHAVLDPVDWLADVEGADAEYLAVDARGRLDLAAVERRIDANPDDIALISVMWANNEVGTLQPITELVELASAHGIPVHTDAVQAIGQVPVSFDGSGVDALTLTGHKVGGPFGIGALIARRDFAMRPLLHGGGQERDVRSGTLDVPGIVGFAVAVEEAVSERARLAERLTALRDRMVAGVLAQVPDAIYNGDAVGRLPGNAHVRFPGCEGDALLMLLDARGVECSTGSACNAGVPQPSHVLLAMGVSESAARSSLRFSLGHTSTDADVTAVIEAIGPVVERARAASSLGRTR